MKPSTNFKRKRLSLQNYKFYGMKCLHKISRRPPSLPKSIMSIGQAKTSELSIYEKL
jgi:hypothetical protein